MGSQTPALDKLFDEWARKHAEKISTEAPYEMTHEAPYGGFVRDGIVNLENWKKQKVRICFLLNEAGGYDDIEKFPNGHDVAAEWNERGAWSMFLFKIAIWAKAVQDAFVSPVTYNKKEILRLRPELIRSLAVVNIKKSDGQKRSDFDLIQRFATEDAAEIRRELELVNPNIIICGENFKFLRGPRPEGADENTKREKVFYDDEINKIAKLTYQWGSKLIFSFWTPANFVGTMSSNTINYYAVREICRGSLKVFTSKKK